MSLMFDQTATFRTLPARFAYSTVRAFGAVFGLIHRFVAAEIDRRQTMALLELDGHALRDLGISRSDVESALMVDAGRKPSYALAARRREARHAERAQHIEAKSAPQA